MSETRQLALMLKGMISELPKEDQEKVANVIERIQAIQSEYPDQFPMALALVGAAMAEKQGR